MEVKRQQVFGELGCLEVFQGLVVLGVYFLRSCGVTLFYFLTLQAAGRLVARETAGKRCTGLLPAARLQTQGPIRQGNAAHSKTAHGHARPWWMGPEPAASQTSAAEQAG